MRKLLLTFVCSGVACAVWFVAQQAQAIPAFKKEFDKLYVKRDGSAEPEKTFAAAVGRAKCNVCHVGTSRKNRNIYGQALDKLLDKKTDAKNSQKIIGALQEVEKQHSKPGEDKSPTFGDLIQQGKLPGGDGTVEAAADPK